MAKIVRYTGNMFPFANGAAAGKRQVFGSAVTESNTLNENMNADFNLGWQIVDPTAGAKPPQQWFNSSLFASTAQTIHLYQQGISPWDVAQEFFVGSITKGSDNRLYVALIDNVGKDPLVSPLEWQLTVENDFLLHLFATNGYQIFPGGLIIQWGQMEYLAADGVAGTLATLPIAFPNAFLNATSSDRLNGAHVTAVETASLTQIRAWGRIANGNLGDTTLSYTAIGY